MASRFGNARVNAGKYVDANKPLREALGGIGDWAEREGVRAEDKLRYDEKIKRQTREDEWNSQVREQQVGEWKRAAAERTRLEGIRASTAAVDANTMPVDSRIGATNEKVLAMIERGEIGNVAGTREEQAQHQRFIKELDQAYTEAGPADRIDAQRQFREQYIAAGNDAVTADRLATIRTKDLASSAEKLSSASASAEKDYERRLSAYNASADRALKIAGMQSKEKIANTKAIAAKNKKSGDYSSPSKAMSTLTGKLVAGGIRGSDMDESLAMIGEMHDLGYGYDQIGSVVDTSIIGERDAWLSRDPRTRRDTLIAGLSLYDDVNNKLATGAGGTGSGGAYGSSSYGTGRVAPTDFNAVVRGIGPAPKMYKPTDTSPSGKTIMQDFLDRYSEKGAVKHPGSATTIDRGAVPVARQVSAAVETPTVPRVIVPPVEAVEMPVPTAIDRSTPPVIEDDNSTYVPNENYGAAGNAARKAAHDIVNRSAAVPSSDEDTTARRVVTRNADKIASEIASFESISPVTKKVPFSSATKTTPGNDIKEFLGDKGYSDAEIKAMMSNTKIPLELRQKLQSLMQDR